MREEFRYGGLAYVSFGFLDVLCLILANIAAIRLYSGMGTEKYGMMYHSSVLVIMVAVDLLVTYVFNTLSRVLRRRNRVELVEGLRHVGISFVILAVILFPTKSGATYSRVTIYLAYVIYFFLLTGFHIAWKMLLKHRKETQETAMLVTTDGFADEGITELKKLNINVRYIYLLKNIEKDQIGDIPVVRTWEDAASAICWKMLDKVYIYGLDHQMVPDYLVKACREMGLDFSLVDFNYRMIDIKTIQHPDHKYGALSFLEGKRDIPFPIRRVYWITETEAELHRGFHAHKLNCQLLYCPYGVINLILDDGETRTTVTLDEPGKGLILMPGLWREMVWQQTGSVLCVLASEYYDAEEYIRNYDDFIAYSKKYRRTEADGCPGRVRNRNKKVRGS